MHFKEKASLQFPNAEWTGGSSIHASIARAASVPLPFSNPRLIMKTLVTQNFPGYVYRTIIKYCPDMEWLMGVDDFSNLLLVDFYRLLHGQGTMETQKRLKNPKTGNVFHRITLLEAAGIVGGVRVWLMPDDSTNINIGWRFRLEDQVSESINIRQKAIELAKSLEPEVELIAEYVAKETKESSLQLESFVKD
jgi:hypothetical protein